MNPPKFNEDDYINFLTAGPRIFTCTEAERVQSGQKDAPCHDAVGRVLHRMRASASALRNEALPFAGLNSGVLIPDDSALDKLYARHIGPVSHYWSGKHHSAVKGINLITLLWTDGDAHIPCDYRIYCREQDGKTKNDHFADMLHKAKVQGFEPSCVLFDSWHAGADNLRTIRKYGWHWLTRLKSNRPVNPDGKGNVPLSPVSVPETGTAVHPKDYGFVKVFGIAAKDGETEYWATDLCETDELRRLQFSEFSWKTEKYHRGIKQFCGAERSQVRTAKARRNHTGFAVRTFLRFSVCCFRTGCSWFEAKFRIVRDAVRNYMANPAYVLNPTA